jgi:hypothetical protein
MELERILEEGSQGVCGSKMDQSVIEEDDLVFLP